MVVAICVKVLLCDVLRWELVGQLSLTGSAGQASYRLQGIFILEANFQSKLSESMPTSQTPNSSRAWSALNPALSEWILTAVATMGFERMTPVQANAIPLFTGNKDVVVEVRQQRLHVCNS